MNKLNLVAWLFILVGHVSAHNDIFVAEQHSISCTATVLDSDDLVVDTQEWELSACDFIKYGYRPVRVCVQNKGDTLISIPDNSRQYNQISIEGLASLYRYHAFLRTYYLLVARSAVIGLLGAGICYCYENTGVEFFAGAAALCGLCTTTLILPFYDYVTLCDLNARLALALVQVLRPNTILIKPGESAEKIVLVLINQNMFELPICDEEGQLEVAKFHIACA